ncbi:ribosome maturation factor RimP [Nicoliella spurrieriana]|uniref:Ribosome maturation factor RimP n=1 Tax=Nicoliella spurrieriana TaxID=2925830 RepID=A0A976X585_9LACO|nr:ribosome maturation factor RimP [Nicoliella spurrieriana]UQS86504.1 ribosome maturation factor RimP [Nicoliella spurrieriana]
MSNVPEIVKDVLTPILDQHQFELFDVEYVKESQNWYLRVYIDKPDGITIEDCAIISDQLGEKLDAMDPDPIPQAYYLEVSSPGAERPLRNEKEIKDAIGSYINVSLYYPIKKNKIYQGTLKDVTADNNLVIEYNDMSVFRELEIPSKAIAKVRLAIKF